MSQTAFSAAPQGRGAPIRLGSTAGMDRTTAELLRQIGIATSPRRPPHHPRTGSESRLGGPALHASSGEQLPEATAPHQGPAEVETSAAMLGMSSMRGAPRPVPTTTLRDTRPLGGGGHLQSTPAPLRTSYGALGAAGGSAAGTQPAQDPNAGAVVLLDSIGMDNDDREFATLLSKIVRGHAHQTAAVDAEFSVLHESVEKRMQAVSDREASISLGGGPPAPVEYTQDGRRKEANGGRSSIDRLVDDTLTDFLDAQRGAQAVLGGTTTTAGGGAGGGGGGGEGVSQASLKPEDLDLTAGDHTPGAVVGLPMTPGRRSFLGHGTTRGAAGGATTRPGAGGTATRSRGYGGGTKRRSSRRVQTPGRRRSMSRGPGSVRPNSSVGGDGAVSQRDVHLAESALEQSMARIQRGEAPLYVPDALTTARKVERARALEKQRRMVATFKERFAELAETIRVQHANEHMRIIDSSLNEVTTLVTKHMRRKVSHLDHTSKDNGQTALIQLSRQCLVQMEQWVRDLKARLDNETTQATQQLRERFELEATDTLTQLAESAQQQKEDAVRQLLLDIKATKEKHVAELKDAMKRERDTKLAHMRQKLEDKLQHEMQELEQLVTVEGGRRLEQEISSLRSSYVKQRQDAQRSMVEANRQAASALRSQLEKEHAAAMEEMAKKTLADSENELSHRRAQVRQEAQSRNSEALQQVRKALVEGHNEDIEQLRRDFERRTREEIARVRAEFKNTEGPKLAILKQQLEEKFSTEVEQARKNAERATDAAKKQLHRVMEEQKVARVVQVTTKLRREKEKAEAAARERADAEAEVRIAALVKALENDKTKAVINLQQAKKLELQQRLTQLETKLVSENNAFLSAEVAKWDEVRGQVEGHLRSMLQVPSVVSGSDSEGEGAAPPVPEGVQGKALFWIRTLSSQFRDMATRFKAVNTTLGHSAKEVLVLKRQVVDRNKEVQRLQHLLDEATRREAAEGLASPGPCRRCKELQAANRDLLAKVSMLEQKVRTLETAAASQDSSDNPWRGRFEGVDSFTPRS